MATKIDTTTALTDTLLSNIKQSQALAISPSLPKGTESSTEMNLGELCSLATT